MALPNNEVTLVSTHELLDAQAHIWNHILNYINSMSLKCALQLGIPDVIHKHGKPMSISRLADALSINDRKSHGLRRLMRILTHSKFFAKVKIPNDELGYCLTSASRLLLRDEPFSIAPFVLAMLDPMLIDPWHNVSEWFRNDTASPFVAHHGMMLWELLGHDEGGNRLFNEGMASDARCVASVLTKECRHVFEGLGSMVDVGGGTGMLAKGIAEAFPELECIVFDLPHVVDGMEGSKNLRYVSGDMWECVPHADAVLLKWTLHDWDDEDSVKLLKKCKEAINPSKNNGGKVIIIEMVLVDDKEEEEHDKATETKLFFDMLMMVEVTGKERTEKEWAKLFYAAGFSTYNITRGLGLRSVIEVFP
ncbi:hypothetical protein CASFOL_025284 [Castilleja foliolosa]|uniref:O-methyltransferase n=1 Tax=Castilleja foliolosa TaxID=1961234 RepID=A0ABD3CQP7_9LAMI